jgi:predicted CopG family antitoxin
MKTLTISIQDSTYQELKKITEPRQVSKFIDQLIAEEIKRKNQQLIADYKSFTSSQAMRKEDQIRAGAVGDGVK